MPAELLLLFRSYLKSLSQGSLPDTPHQLPSLRNEYCYYRLPCDKEAAKRLQNLWLTFEFWLCLLFVL